MKTRFPHGNGGKSASGSVRFESGIVANCIAQSVEGSFAMPEEFSYDVFISYSSKDKDWVRGELLKRIEQTGLKAFIDFRDFTPGAPSIKECERGVVECRKTLLVLTPNYLSSGWTEIENIMAQTLDPANESLRMIPLLKEKCEKPLRIGALTHIDFTEEAEEDLAWKKLFIALGKPPETEEPEQPERNDWFLAHPYPMPPNFTGRVQEKSMLSEWLNSDDEHALLSLRALGGFGKSALTWHWLTHEVDPARWPHVVWWSFYERDASFEQFLDQTLDYLGLQKHGEDKLQGKHAVEALVNKLQEPGTLLVLDGFERELRAFGSLDAAYQGDGKIQKENENDRDCISPLAEDFLRKVASLPQLESKVLLSTRLTPQALECQGSTLLTGSQEEELLQLHSDDAVAFFAAQGIRGTHTEIKAACTPYGFHPLSLRILAGLIVNDFEQAGDITVAKQLNTSEDIVESQNHLLEVSYNNLSESQQQLLSWIACFRSPVDFAALQSLAETRDPLASKEREQGEGTEPPSTLLDLKADLRALLNRGFVSHDKQKNYFDLHPIVRRYAYERLGKQDQAMAHNQLRDYFAAVPELEKVTHLDELSPVIELYHHTVRAGQYDEACELFRDRLVRRLYYQFGAYQLCIELLAALFPEGEDQLPRLKSEDDQAWALAALASSYSLSGQPRRALPLYQQQIRIREKLGDKRNLSVGSGNLANRQSEIGELQSAESNLLRRIKLAKDIEDEFQEAIGHQELGRLLAYRGKYEEASAELLQAMDISEEHGYIQSQGVVRANRARNELLELRSNPTVNQSPQAALEAAHQALKFADEDARTDYPVERDYVQAHWLLGAACRVDGQPKIAERHLNEALERCRRINLVELEANILIDLARLRRDLGEGDEAERLAQDAQVITERSEYVLQGADVHLELAKLAQDRGEKDKALQHAQEAKNLATCDGPPDYTYYAAYTEATALLEALQA